MPGTVVHLAFSGMIAAALLGAAYDRRSVFVVLAVTALADLDAFIALVSIAGHRTVLHTFVVPLTGAALLWVDTTLRPQSAVGKRWGARGVRVAWVAILAYALSAIGLDIVKGVVNPLWPVHDQFYTLEGKIELSDQRGVVQTFVEFDSGETVPAPEGKGSSQEVNLTTGVEPDPTGEKKNPERIFPVVRSGWELVLLVVGTAVTWARFRVPHGLSEDD